MCKSFSAWTKRRRSASRRVLSRPRHHAARPHAEPLRRPGRFPRICPRYRPHPGAADPALGAALLRLPGKKYIFTNGSRRHAEKVAERLGFPGHFEGIFDIVSAKLLPKPERATYDLFVGEFGIDPARAAMFEDLARNLIVPKAIGMRTVLVVPAGIREVFHDEWEYEGRDDDQVDYVTDDLGRFVTQIADAIGA
jgi:putative hydrolase of the HAD superfamily